MGPGEPDDLLTELDRCRPWIEAALTHSGGTHEWDDIVAGIRDGNLQFWPAPDACVVTEVLDYPRKRVLHVFLAGGRLATIKDMTDSIRAWARAQGCSGATLYGRPGWARVLPGWRLRHVVMEMEV